MTLATTVVREMRRVPHDCEPLHNRTDAWRVRFRAAECPDAVRTQLLRARHTSMEWHVHFPDDFPMSPPFVRVASPAFEPMSGHITAEGAFCAAVLAVHDSPDAWRPTVRVDALLSSLLHLMNDGGPRVSKRARSYDDVSEERARQGLVRVTRRYGWVL